MVQEEVALLQVRAGGQNVEQQEQQQQQEQQDLSMDQNAELEAGERSLRKKVGRTTTTTMQHAPSPGRSHSSGTRKARTRSSGRHPSTSRSPQQMALAKVTSYGL
ncbi:unnamed protein product [Polarella glacialis]|uniref:Uncharacterized protein n=1 Tax=Polarella glacialis TaxID=89957 RepID=A0A813JL66_POLGL|nr:unnamed protein product [Polarella glacialis]